MLARAWLLFVIAGACFLIAALTVAISGFDIGPALAWFYGGFAAWLFGLAATVPRPPPV